MHSLDLWPDITSLNKNMKRLNTFFRDIYFKHMILLAFPKTLYQSVGDSKQVREQSTKHSNQEVLFRCINTKSANVTHNFCELWAFFSYFL